MKALIIGWILLTWASQVGHQKIFAEASEVTFKVQSSGGINSTEGSFRGLEGKAFFDPQQPDKSFFNVKINASTIETGINLRDNHLQNQDFFDVDNYPYIHFTSSEVMKTNNGFVTTGTLKIKDITKTVEIPFQARQEENTIKLSGELAINRKNFNLGNKFGRFFIDYYVKVSIYCVILE